MKYIEGNIFNIKTGYILHQCNCVSVYPYGLSANLEKVYPGTCPYKFRQSIKTGTNICKKEDRSTPGTLSILGKENGPYVINIFGQFFPGKAGNVPMILENLKVKDLEVDREMYFENALDSLVDYFWGTDQTVEIRIPFGLGMDKINWNKYEKMLLNFEEKMKKNRINLEMTIYC